MTVYVTQKDILASDLGNQRLFSIDDDLDVTKKFLKQSKYKSIYNMYDIS